MAKSTPMVTTVVSMPDFTSILSMPMTALSRWKKASMMMEKVVRITSMRMPKTTSSSEGNMVTKKEASASSATVSTELSNTGMEKPPPDRSCRWRAVARPKV